MSTPRTTGRARELSVRLGALLDERVGIVHELSEVPRAAGAPDFFGFAARACNTSAFASQQNFINTGGVSADPDVAIGKAIGEAVERYCGALYDIEDFPLASRRHADFECIAPIKFALYRSDQYSQPGFYYVPFGDDTPVRWVPAFNAVTGAVQHVPAAAVFVPYFYYQGSGEAPVMQPISTGLACGRTPLEATVASICEVVERDAFLLTWQAMMRPPIIDPASLDPTNSDLVDRFRGACLDVQLFDITTDLGLPTVMAVLRAQSPEQAARVFASATAPTGEVAARKSLEELEHTRRYSQRIMDNLPRLEVRENHDNVIDQMDHLNFWCDHGNAGLSDFLFGNDLRVSLSQLSGPPGEDNQERLCRIVKHISRSGHDILLVDLTTPDVATAGLTVVRAVIPGLHPLFMGHRYRALGGSRLGEVPQRLGHAGITDGDNPAPHPFP